MAQSLGVKDAKKPVDFITMLVKLQEKIGGLVSANPCEMSREECVEIFRKSYR